jgi:hypothetical protein
MVRCNPANLWTYAVEFIVMVRCNAANVWTYAVYGRRNGTCLEGLGCAFYRASPRCELFFGNRPLAARNSTPCERRSHSEALSRTLFVVFADGRVRCVKERDISLVLVYKRGALVLGKPHTVKYSVWTPPMDVGRDGPL